MNRYSKILHHIDVSDMRDTHAKKLAAKKIQEDKIIADRKYIRDVMDDIKSDWKKELEEGMTTTNVLGGQTLEGSTDDLVNIPYGLTGDGGLDFGEPDNFNDTTYTGDGEYTVYSNMGDMRTVEDPTGVGPLLRVVGYDFGESQAYPQGGAQSSSPATGSPHPSIPGFKEFSHRFMQPSGNWTYHETNNPNGYTNRYGETQDVLGKPYGSWNSNDGVTDYGFGTALQTLPTGGGWFSTNDIDTSEVDTLKLHAAVGGNRITAPAEQVQLYYWAGNKPGFQSVANKIYAGGLDWATNRGNDGWRPIYQKPDGTIDETVNHIIIPFGRPAENAGKLAAYTKKLPEWCRGKNSRFIFFGGYGWRSSFSVTSVRFQRLNRMVIGEPLDSPEATSFVRLGQGSNDTSPEERKKKIEEMLAASRAYLLKVMGFADFPGMGASLSDIAASPIGLDQIHRAYADTLSRDEARDYYNWVAKRQSSVTRSQGGYRQNNKDSKKRSGTYTYLNSPIGKPYGGKPFTSHSHRPRGGGFVDSYEPEGNVISEQQKFLDLKEKTSRLFKKPVKKNKLFGHIGVSDMRKSHTKKLDEKKIKAKEAKYIKDQLEILKFDWRSSLNEKMGTGDVFAYSADAQPDVDLTVVDATLDASFGIHPDGVATFGYSANGLQGGTVIRDSGTGTGSNGGFDIGKHLAFTGDTYYNLRWAALNPIDASALDTIVITAIRGNDVNGGEDPDAEYEDLEVWYRTKDMAHNGMRGINITPDGTTVSGVERKIIPIGSDSSGLRDWSLELPAHVRTPETQFFLVQNTSSGAQFDHYGVTEIKFRRNTPLNVVVPLDSPEAISFVRVGSNEGDPKKRKKKVEDQLKASKEYTDFVMGKDFPGMGATLDDTEQSPIGKDQVAGSFKKAGTPQKTIQQFLQTDDITGEPIEKKIEKSFSQFAPEVTPDGEPAPDPIPVNGNKNVVLGQDAQALETSAAEDPAQREAEKEAEKEVAQAEKEAEKEVAQAEKEAELTDDEKEELKNQGKTEDEIKQEGQNKKDQAKLDALTAELIRRNDYVAHDVAGMNEILSNVTWLVGVFNDHLNPISWIVKAFGGEVNSGKLINNLTIARSIFTGRVENHIPLTREITNFTNYLTPDIFQSSHFNYVPISDTRHPYADDNIKVSLNGEVSINDGSHQSLATKAYPSLGDSGNGYAQLIALVFY